MSNALIFIGPIIGGLILFFIMSALVRSPGSLLQSKFQSLGTLKGKTYDEIVAKCGTPSSVSASVDKEGNQVIIKQWQATSYHIVLLFDENDICLGVSHEAKV